MKESKAVPGDKVEVHFLHKFYSGTLLETPENEKGIIFLKLDSGYNIGLDKKEIEEIKVLEKGVEKKIVEKIKLDSKKPNVGMIITGGTIAARLNPRKGGVDWLTSSEDLFKYYPSMFQRVNISKIEISFMKASEDMDYKDWQKIASSVEKMLNDQNIKGVVVTHGTDFLHYTSAALSFFLKDLNKPVVLTYSQRSVDRASSDANLNLQCAAEVAGFSDIAEVVLVGHATSSDDYCNVMRGTKVRKMHTSMRDAFKVINDKPIAKVFSDGRMDILEKHKVRNSGKVKVDLKFEEKIALVKVYPGGDPRVLDFYVSNGYKGIVLELSGLGHSPTGRSRNNWIKKIKEIDKKGVFVVGVSQCVYGRTDPFVYSNGREMIDAGVIYVDDMLAETAFVKLGWVLAHAKTKNKIEFMMKENFVGEINERLEFDKK